MFNSEVEFRNRLVRPALLGKGAELLEKVVEEYGWADLSLADDCDNACNADSKEGLGIRDRMLDFNDGLSLMREEMRGINA